MGDLLFVLALACGASFLLNAAPAFAPPTWLALVAIRLQWPDTPLVPLVAAGAVGAVIGRMALAYAASLIGDRFIPSRLKANLLLLAALEGRARRFPFVSVLGVASIPLPSNQVFIAAGLARLNLWRIALIFGVSRFVIDLTLMLGATEIGVAVIDLLTTGVFNLENLLVGLAGFAGFLAIGLFPWQRLLDLWLGRVRAREPEPSEVSK